jgi:hypothetical protein
VASPQKENGFAQIATELLPAIFRLITRLGSTQATVLAEVLAVQYGKDKPDAVRLEFKAMEESTGLSRSHLTRAASSLVRRNVLVKVGHGLYRFNKDYETWIYDADPESTTKSGTLSDARKSTTHIGTLKVPPIVVPESTHRVVLPSYIESEIKEENTPPNPPTGGMVCGGEVKSPNPESTPPVPDHVVKLAAAAARINLDFDWKVRSLVDTEMGWPYAIMKEAIRVAATSNAKAIGWGLVAFHCRRLEAEGFQGQPEPSSVKPLTDAEREAIKAQSAAREAELREISRKSNEAAEAANPEIRAVWAEMADRARERLAGGARPRRSMAAQPRVIRPPIERVELPTDDEIEARRATQLRALEEFRARSATG